MFGNLITKILTQWNKYDLRREFIYDYPFEMTEQTWKHICNNEVAYDTITRFDPGRGYVYTF